MGKDGKSKVVLGFVLVIFLAASFNLFKDIGGRGALKSNNVNYNIEERINFIQDKLIKMTDDYIKAEESATILYLYIEEEDKSISKNKATDALITLSKHSEDASQLMNDTSYLLFKISEKHGY